MGSPWLRVVAIVKRLEPIIDYHGKKIEPEIVYKSAGVFIYLDVGEEFARLRPEQARDLARRLNAAADEVDPSPAPVPPPPIEGQS
jgi:hypothetical protein